jgi:hypothetical protein
MSEFDVLLSLDKSLAALASRGALLGTYNGRKHDLAVLRRRSARYWMFGLPGLDAASRMDHLDVMLRQRKDRRDQAPTLREACAAMGIGCFNPKLRQTKNARPDLIKCQADVVATFILTLYELAIERGSPEVLVAGWTGLSEFLGRQRPRWEHLEHFRNHPILRAGQNVQAQPSKCRSDA